jgi:hypothetical protein
MNSLKTKQKIGQPEIMVAQTNISRDAVTITFPKSILLHTDITNGVTYFCMTNGVLQVSGDKPVAEIPMLTLEDEAFIPQS